MNPINFQGAFDSAHRRHQTDPGLVAGGGDDFVSDKEVPDFDLWVKREDIGTNPVIGEVLIRRNVDDKIVRDHDGYLDIRVV